MNEPSNQPTTPVDTSVSLDVHPSVANKYAADLDVESVPAGRKALASTRDALTAAYSLQSTINEVESSLRAMAPPDAPVYRHNGQIRKEHGSEEQLAAQASQVTERTLQTIDRRIGEIEAMSTSLQTLIAASIDHPERKSIAGAAEGTEIRSYVRGLSETERLSFVRTAINQGDLRTVAAVLHSPAYLSGLDASTQQLLRGFAEHKFAPDQARVVRGMTQAVNHLKQSARSLAKRTSEITSVASARAAKRQAALGKLK